MPTSQPSRRKLSRPKRFAFAAGALLLGWTITELLAWGILWYVESSYKFTAREMQTVLKDTAEPTKVDIEAIHPYLGWVINPEMKSTAELFGREIPTNSFGFSDVEHGVPKRRGDRVIVAIAGGSVAWQVSVAGEELLRKELEASPQFRGRKLQLVRLAMSGYKQPQQLMELNFMLALGAEFDVLVNIDGYNEVALTMAENDDRGVFAAYPRMWHARLQNVVDPRKYPMSFRLFQVRGQRQQLAIQRLESWLHWSPTLNVIWYLRDKQLEAEFVKLQVDLQQADFKQGFGFNAVGPKQLYKDRAGLKAHTVDLWANCSLQLMKLCDANGIAYLHLLQPNQYLPNSKVLTAVEQEKCIYIYQEYGKAIAEAYPLLIKRGPELQQAGIDFHDLTMLFSQERERIYADPFCHYNERGNEMLAQTLSELIQRVLERAQQ